MNNLKSLFIEFYTPTLEPPYAYSFNATMQKESAVLAIDFKLEYIGREDYSEEELLEEGLNPETEFHWKGSINQNWESEFAQALQHVKLVPEEDENNCFVKAEFTNKKTIEGFVTRNEQWEYLIQEFQQAILEASGREYPFAFNFIERKNGNEELRLTIIASFSERKATFLKKVNKDEDEKALDWASFNNLIPLIFSVDLVQELAEETEPARDGFFIELGDDVWYNLPDAIDKPGKNKAKADKIIAELKKI